MQEVIVLKCATFIKENPIIQTFLKNVNAPKQPLLHKGTVEDQHVGRSWSAQGSDKGYLHCWSV